MSRLLTLEIADDVYHALEIQAGAAGTSPAQVAVKALEQFTNHGNGRQEVGKWSSDAAKDAARARFARNLGAVRLNFPTGSDNEGIDAALAQEYLSNHETK